MDRTFVRSALRAPVLATVTAAALVQAADLAAGSASSQFLLWNLLLAWAPVPFALVALAGHRRGLGLAPLSPLLAGWLLFFPNAPYLVTDLVHLGRLPGVPTSLEVAVLSTAALAGLLVGLASLATVHRIVGERAGRAGASALVVAAVVLSSFGVYLGRFLRWNSWDAITSPGPLLTDVAERLADPAAHPVAWGGTALFSLFLLAAYAASLAVTRR